MEILREASEDDLDFIVEKLKLDLPYTLKDLHYISSMRRIRKMKNKFPNLSVKILPKFYVPTTSVHCENCTLFAITGHENHVVWFITLEKDLKELRECLFKTKLIKWNELVLFHTIHREQILPIFEYIELNNIKLHENEEASMYNLSKENAMMIDVEFPPNGTYVKELTKSDAKFCNENWIYASEKSEHFLESLIEVNGGFGLFSEQNHEILSFVIFNEHRAIGMLTTLESAKRKGFGEFLAKFITKKIVEKFQIEPITFINNLNPVSINLFTKKLKFEKNCEMNWICVGNKE